MKAHHTSKLLDNIVSVARNYRPTELQALAAQMTAGCAGLDYGSQAHVSGAIKWGTVRLLLRLLCWLAESVSDHRCLLDIWLQISGMAHSNVTGQSVLIMDDASIRKETSIGIDPLKHTSVDRAMQQESHLCHAGTQTDN